MTKPIVPVVWVVLYLRMSSGKQDKSIPAQRDALLALAKRKGYKVRREYIDEAVSGDATEKRTGFLRLREDAETLGDFSIILVWDEDRFSRNDPLELGYWLKPIRDAGVILETPKGQVDWETLGGRLIYLISQEMKHNYLRDLSRNVSRGMLAAANSEKRRGTGGLSPSGYEIEDGEVVVDPDLAAVIRRIFELYLEPGNGLRAVADALNRDGIPAPRTKLWGATTIRKILTNRKYCGAYIRFRHKCGKFNGIDSDGEIVSRSKRDKLQIGDPTILVEQNHEPIISQDLFDRVQTKLERNRTRTAQKTGRQYPFSGLIRCGDCGAPMSGRSFRCNGTRHYTYGCRTYHEKGPQGCYSNSMSETRLLRCIVRKIQEQYLSEAAIERLRKQIRKQQQADRKIPRVDQKRLRKRIKDLDRQIDQGAERVFSAPEAIVPKLYAKLERLREERDQIQDQLTAAETPQNGRDKKDEAEVEAALQTLTELSTAIEDADPEDLREILAGIVSRIELHYSHDTSGKKRKNTFEHGTIFVRPPVESSLLCTNDDIRRPPGGHTAPRCLGQHPGAPGFG